MTGLYITLTFIVVGLSFLAKDNEYRIVAWTIFIGSRATGVVYGLTSGSWAGFNWPLFSIDAAAFLIMMTIALRSKRYWPLWITALQFGALLSFFSSSLASEAVSYAIGVTASFWAWLQLAIMITVAIFCQNQRRLQA
jgi:hypothetical protein